MVVQKNWDEFRSSGLLWFVNMILHAFGWAIVFNYDDGNIVDVYPARVGFRGFSEKINTDGYIRLSDYLLNNIKDIAKEAMDE